jgi:CheY-like chemotaxis protein
MTATASLAPESDADDRIAVAAHEIRTPLGGILALADLLLAEDHSAGARGHASALKASAEHLFDVATSLLGGDARQERTAEVRLSEFVARVATPIAARSTLKGVAFQAVVGPDVPERIVVDEGALRQIVDNLADNALRATDEGRIELVLERVTDRDGAPALRVAVRDTGPGLGSQPERLFAPFVQGAASRGAAGLGLALVARLAARMGGSAEAHNRAGGGAEVAAILRLEPVADTPARPDFDQEAPRILVVEDNAINRRVLATLLGHFGRPFDMVHDGESAVAAVAGGRYGLVLMDATMPGLDGLDATRAIRALGPPHGDIRIVGVTARAFDHEIAAFRDAGADDVVTKPLSVATLWRAIGERTERSA